MFWLGLLLPVCFVAGYTGASVPTQWAVLSIILPACLWRVAPYNIGHKLFFLFGAYAFATLFWSINLYSWVWGMWHVFIWALAYHCGTLCTDLRPLWKGLALGLTVSTGVAVAQALDYAPVHVHDPFLPAGLLYNSSLFGIILGLVLTALVVHHLWWYMPPLAIGLVLSGSRGGFLILGLGLLARFAGPVLAAGVLACAAMAFLVTIDLADNQRLMIWGVTIRVLSIFGQGAGSFADIHYIAHAKNLLIRPEYVHNDILQLAYEYGIGAIPLLAIPALALATSRSAEWTVLFVWCAAAGFYFPLYTPLTAFIGLVVAGHCMRDRVMVRINLHRWRSVFLPRPTTRGPADGLARREAIPMVARASHTEVL